MTGAAIRRATDADSDAIAALTREAYTKWVTVIGRLPLPMTVDYNDPAVRHGVDLLEIGDRLVGLIELIPGPDHLLIESVAVDPAFQGQGLGRALLHHAEQTAGSMGLTRIRLYTNKAFHQNVSLYLGLGYSIDREALIESGFIVHMSKVVEGPL